MASDLDLGAKVAAHLSSLGIETPLEGRPLDNPALIQGSVEDIMRWGLGMDLSDDSLSETPHRVAKMYSKEIFYGLDYSNFPKCSTFSNKMHMDEMVAVRGADVLSVCEHHLVPFIGKAAVGYIPNTKVLGLSKINRVVDFFSRRPQVQERLTLQIYHALQLILETDDIAVVINAEHYCVRLRGVKQDSNTITSKMGGKFMSTPSLREEFLQLTR